MVAAKSVHAGGHQAWAQVGYIDLGAAASGDFSAQGFRTFDQYIRACSVRNNCGPGERIERTRFFAALTGESQLYAAYLRSADDRIHMTAGGTDLGYVEYDVSGDWSTAWNAQYGVETDHDEDDIPGVRADPVNFDYLQRFLQNGSTSYSSNLTLTPLTGPRYHRGALDPPAGGQGFFVWTEPLT